MQLPAARTGDNFRPRFDLAPFLVSVLASSRSSPHFGPRSTSRPSSLFSLHFGPRPTSRLSSLISLHLGPVTVDRHIVAKCQLSLVFVTFILLIVADCQLFLDSATVDRHIVAKCRGLIHIETTRKEDRDRMSIPERFLSPSYHHFYKKQQNPAMIGIKMPPVPVLFPIPSTQPSKTLNSRLRGGK